MGTITSAEEIEVNVQILEAKEEETSAGGTELNTQLKDKTSPITTIMVQEEVNKD